MGQRNPLLTVATRRSTGLWHLFGALVASVEAMLVVVVAVACGMTYHLVQYATVGEVPLHISVGIILALMFVTLCALQGQYRLSAYIAPTAQLKWPITTWAASVLYAVALGFLSEAGSEVSRGTAVLLTGFGLLTVIVERRLVTSLVSVASNRARIAARRVLLIGSEEGIDAFARQHQPWTLGFQIVGSCA